MPESCTPSAMSCASTGSQVEEHCHLSQTLDALSDQDVTTPRRAEPEVASQAKPDAKLTLPVGKRGSSVAWCDIQDEETLVDNNWLPSHLEPQPTKAAETAEAKNSFGKKQKPQKKVRDVSSRVEREAKTPDAGYARQQMPVHPASPAGADSSSQVVTLGDLGLHCTAWNQAAHGMPPDLRGPPSGPEVQWMPGQGKGALPPPSVMSTAPIDNGRHPVLLPQAALGTSPAAAAAALPPRFGDASTRFCPGASPTVQFGNASIRFIPAGSPMANPLAAATPTACYDASCRTPVNTPMAPANTPMACHMSWPDANKQAKEARAQNPCLPQFNTGGSMTCPGMSPTATAGPWSPVAAPADALRVFLGQNHVTGAELAARLQAAAPDSYED